MFKDKLSEPILVPVYINLEAEIIVYRDINNSRFVWERTSDPSQKRGVIKKSNEVN